jgi:hypothetical protein
MHFLQQSVAFVGLPQMGKFKKSALPDLGAKEHLAQF